MPPPHGSHPRGRRPGAHFECDFALSDPRILDLSLAQFGFYAKLWILAVRERRSVICRGKFSDRSLKILLNMDRKSLQPMAHKCADLGLIESNDHYFNVLGVMKIHSKMDWKQPLECCIKYGPIMDRIIPPIPEPEPEPEPEPIPKPAKTARVRVEETAKKPTEGWATLVDQGCAADWIATVQPVVQALVPPTRRSLDHLRTWYKVTALRWPAEIAAQAVRDFYGQLAGDKGPPKPGAFRKWLKEIRPCIKTEAYQWQEGKTHVIERRADGKEKRLGEWSPAK